ncbi:nicotinate-nucleotide--dimethylbenzimidazole phosphoribosyltransferase [Ideonella livida]|uniref:Nicotinate-nucleotide--dimethylbenzimidazole phosphoribosyltransferase n=1 Tax=Ideonella livida TaxID=2707176 RepID=A0A7C9TIH8_9BURK|nr:nicotinate-nucleotide--dimethylbenzimidazole phosphoribosyltransferase [Ideonella livida]NDY91301.1 nicotinate-nucleotide--dimethylbenzimidazole phosphoribosyltransferase [Ideonella livida]
MDTTLRFDILPQDTPAHDALRQTLQARIDGKTKPLGALGRLEDLALQLGLIQGRPDPVARQARVIVCAGDHGIAHEGVSAYPQEVTWQMVMNFLAGGAAVNVLARSVGMEVQVVDAGVAHDFGRIAGLVHAKVAPGTANSAVQPAMTAAQCDAALARGRALAHQAAEAGCQVLALGEMGIANTSAASLLLHKLAGVPLEVATGRGTGVDDAGLARKRAVLTRAAARTGTLGAFDALCEYGGLEIAMMAGAMLGAAERRLLVLVDGFIASSALLAAYRLAPAVRDYAVFAHQSAEAGHAALLQALQARPLLALDLRLGEGTGAVLAWPLVQAAAAFLDGMASFAAAGVSGQSA